MTIWDATLDIESKTGGSDTYTGTAERTVGGITEGTVFSGASMTTMWNSLLKQEKFPLITAPFSIFTSNQTGFREVGESLSISFNSSYNRGSISPQYTASSPYHSGLPNEYQYIGPGLISKTKTDLSDSQTINNYIVLINGQSWQNRVSYDIGVQPKSSYGNDYLTPLESGTTEYITRTITGVYPAFATTSNLTVLTKQTLISMNSNYIEVVMIAEDGINKQQIKLPDVWSEITGIEFFNSVSGSFEWIGGSKSNSLLTFTMSSSTEIIQGNTIPYKVFTHNGATIGSRILRFYTT